VIAYILRKAQHIASEVRKAYRMEIQDTTENRLVELSIDGNQSAFKELIQRYQRSVWGIAYRTLGNYQDCQDAVQETFFRVYRFLPRFDRTKLLGPWIMRIAANYCIDQLRRKKSRKCLLWSELKESEQQRALITMADDNPSASMTPDDRILQDRLVRQLLEGLRPKRRMAFLLRELEGYDYQQVGEMMGMSTNAVKVCVSRARTDLQKGLQKYLHKMGRRNEP
jgi:RNA polymerase sigma-70 factor, ECF subfamily